MASNKSCDRSTKNYALTVWIALCTALLGFMLLPLYWYWDRFAARPTLFALILCSLAWALFNWWKLAFTVLKGIRNLPEKQ